MSGPPPPLPAFVKTTSPFMDTFYSGIAGSRQEKAQTCVWIFKATLRWPVEGQRFTPCPLFCVIFELLHSPFWIRKRGPLFCFVAHDSPCYILVSDFIFFSFFWDFNVIPAACASQRGRSRIGARGRGVCPERAYYHWRCWQCEHCNGTDWSCQQKQSNQHVQLLITSCVCSSSFAPLCIKRTGESDWSNTYAPCGGWKCRKSAEHCDRLEINWCSTCSSHDYRKILWIFLFFSFAFPHPSLTVQHLTLLFAIDTKFGKWEGTAYFVPLCAMIF